MDDRQFDNWARTVAGLGSRRRVLGGLVGVGGAALLAAFRRGASDVAAHHGSSGPGDPCRHDDQCLGADAPLVCAWNGFDYDGDLNCCTYEGNRCGFDEACCGLASLHRRFLQLRGLRECRQRWFRERECPGRHGLHRRYQQRRQCRQHDQRRQYPGWCARLWWQRLQRDGHLGVRRRRDGDRGCQWWGLQREWDRQRGWGTEAAPPMPDRAIPAGPASNAWRLMPRSPAITTPPPMTIAAVPMKGTGADGTAAAAAG